MNRRQSILLLRCCILSLQKGSVTLRQRAPAGLELAKSGHAVLQLILQGVQWQPAHKYCRLDIVMMRGRLCGCSISPAVLNPGLQLNTTVIFYIF